MERKRTKTITITIPNNKGKKYRKNLTVTIREADFKNFVAFVGSRIDEIKDKRGHLTNKGKAVLFYLHGYGLSCQQIARILKIGRNVTYYWTNPKYRDYCYHNSTKQNAKKRKKKREVPCHMCGYPYPAEKLRLINGNFVCKACSMNVD